MAKLKVLYFIQTSKPTNNDKQVAFYTGQSVAFRNYSLVKPNDPAEACDAVMGAVIPKQYENKPTFESVKAGKNVAIPAAIEAVGEAATEAAAQIAATVKAV